MYERYTRADPDPRDDLRELEARYAREHPAGALATRLSAGSPAVQGGWAHDRAPTGIARNEQSDALAGAHRVHRRARFGPTETEHVGHPHDHDEPGYGEFGLLNPGGPGHEYPLSARTRRALRGPKNYVRSDERIYDDVCQRLGSTGDLDAHRIEVRVQAGTVYLSGVAPDRFSKFLAEEISASVAGVREVVGTMKTAR